MDLILARHGNTFAKGDKVVWIGRHEDLPLTKEGEEQAKRLGEALRDVPLEAVFTSQLIRAREFARIALETAGTDLIPVIDERLSELDYGVWGGLTSEEIRGKFGSEALDQWESASIWPKGDIWGSREEEVLQDITSLVSELRLREGPVLVVSSSGTLRYFLKGIPGEFEARAPAGLTKLRTGHIAHLRLSREEGRVLLWNESPEKLTLSEGS